MIIYVINNMVDQYIIMTRSWMCIVVSHCSAIERLWGPVVVDNIVSLAVFQFSTELEL